MIWEYRNLDTSREISTHDFRLLQLGLWRFTFQLRLSRLRQLLSLFFSYWKHHKHDIPQPHWYLFMLGISPAYQRQGMVVYCFSRFLNRQIVKLTSYLETNWRRRSLLSRLGFEVVRTGGLPEKLKFWRWREPRKVIMFRKLHWHGSSNRKTRLVVA